MRRTTLAAPLVLALVLTGGDAAPRGDDQLGFRLTRKSPGERATFGTTSRLCEAHGDAPSFGEVVAAYHGRALLHHDNTVGHGECRAGFRDGRAIAELSERLTLRMSCAIRGKVTVEDSEREGNTARARIMVEGVLQHGQGTLRAGCDIGQGPAAGSVSAPGGGGGNATRRAEACVAAGDYPVTTNFAVASDSDDDFADADAERFVEVKLEAIGRC